MNDNNNNKLDYGLWNMWKVTVILIVFGVLGMITNRFEKFVKDVGMNTHSCRTCAENCFVRDS